MGARARISLPAVLGDPSFRSLIWLPGAGTTFAQPFCHKISPSVPSEGGQVITLGPDAKVKTVVVHSKPIQRGDLCAQSRQTFNWSGDREFAVRLL
jgi:hypothetical protein